MTPFLRSVILCLAVIASGASAQQPINADLITRGTVNAARMPAFSGDCTTVAGSTAISCGVVTTAKLGGDITAAGKALLDDADATAQRATLGLGNAATRAVGTASGTVAAGDDGRLSDQRVPTDGSVSTTKLGGDVTAAGKAFLTAIDAAAQRAGLGLGDSATRAVGTAAGTVAAGDDSRLSNQRTPTDSSVTDAKVASGAAIAESKLALASDAAAGTPSRRSLGTGATQAAAGNDARLSDQRVPTDGSVSTTKLGGDITAFAKTMLDDINASAVRATLGLGTMATEATSTYVTASAATTALAGKLSNVETGGSAVLSLGPVPDGTYFKRSGTTIVGDAAAALGTYKLASRSGSEPDRPAASAASGRAIRLVNLGTGSGYAKSIWQESDGTTWGNVNGIATFFHTFTPGSSVSLVVTDTQYSICPTITVPGGLLGLNAQLRIIPHVRASASQTNNALRVFFGGQILYLSGVSWHDIGPIVRVANAGATNAQTRFGIGNGSTGLGVNGTATYKTQLALDTTADQDITFTMAGTAGDTAQCMGVTVEIVNP